MKNIRTGFVLAFLCAACAVNASWAPLTLEQQVAGADAIAVVTITGTRAAANGDYQSVAVAQVERALKGAKVNALEILFNSPKSPAGRDPLSYPDGQRCLMFMTRISEGKYITFQSLSGKHVVRNGQVDFSDGHSAWHQTLTAAVREIDDLLAKQKAPVAAAAPPPLSTWIKRIAAVATLLGLVLGFVERIRAPTVIVTEESPDYPEWLGWLGWAIAALGAVAYILTDFLQK